MNGTFLLLTISVLIFALVIARKVYTLFKFTDFQMCLSVGSLILGLLFSSIFWLLNLVSSIVQEGFFTTEEGLYFILMMSFESVAFIFCSFCLDLFKWWVFILSSTRKSEDISV